MNNKNLTIKETFASALQNHQKNLFSIMGVFRMSKHWNGIIKLTYLFFLQPAKLLGSASLKP